MIKRKRPGNRSESSGRGKKNKSEGKLRCKSGISVRSDIGFALQKESPSFFPVVQVLIAIAATLSGIYMLQSYLLDRNCVFPISRPDTMFMTIVMTSLSALMISRGKPFFKLAGFAYLIMTVIYIISHSGSVALGFMYTCNTYGDAILEPTPIFDVNYLQDFDPALDMEPFFIALSFIMTLLCSLPCIFYVNFPILFLVTFPMFELGAANNWKPAVWTVAVMIICWVTVLSVSLINHTTKRTSKSNFAVSLKKKAFYLTSNDIKLKYFSSHALAVITAATCAFVCAAIGSKDNYRPDSFKEQRRLNHERFQEFIIRAQKGTFKTPIVPGRSMKIGGINGGQLLGSTTDIKFTDSTQLKISCGRLTRPLYLRGYAGELYEHDRVNSNYFSWDPIELEKRLIDQFDQYGLRTLDYNYLQNTDNQQALGSVSSKITVSSVNAPPDVLYAPHCAQYSGCELLTDETQDFDGMITPNKVHQSYTLDVCAPYPDLSWDEVIERANYYRKSQGFTDNYSFYADYIYSKGAYFEVPEDLVPVIDNIIKSSMVDTKTDSLTVIQTKIKMYLAGQGFSYSTEPGVTFEGGDFIKQFLEGKSGGKGYCQHYASSAVMIMRRLGYPARYAEGFIVEPKQQSEDMSWIKVTDRCAHAWCEVFIDGYGWYPVEFTPGYVGSENPNLTEKDLKKDEDSSSESEEEESSEPEKKKEDSSSKKKKPEESKEESSISEADTPLTSSVATIVVPGIVEVDDSDDSDGGGAVGGGEDGTEQIAISRSQITYMLMMTLFIVGFAAAVVVRRRHLLNELEQSINSSSGSKSVISCYTALLRYISLLGIKNDTTLTDVQLSARITTELGVMSPELNSIFMEISEPAITCYMSGVESDSETAERSRKLLKAAQKTIFGRLNFFGRFSARWISGLY